MVSGVARDESSSGSSLRGQVTLIGLSVQGRVTNYQELAPTALLTSPPHQVGGAYSSGFVSASNPCIASRIIEGAEVVDPLLSHHLPSLHRHPNPQPLQQDDELGAFRPQTVRPGRRPPPPGPGFYHRTLSSSSLLSNKVQVAKSRSEYCGINQVCHSGSNYDLLVGHNANLNPNIRNNLSRSGNIVYRGGGMNLPGISFLDTSHFFHDKESATRELLSGFHSATSTTSACTPGGSSVGGPPPPDRRLLVRGLSRNAFINIPSSHLQQQPHPQDQFYWQQQQQQSYQVNNTSVEQHYQHQFNSSLHFPPKRRVGGSHPDISFCSGMNMMATLPPVPHQTVNSHQVSINLAPSSPGQSRRLLPRIIKKTESSKGVVVGGEQHYARSSKGAIHSNTSSAICSPNRDYSGFEPSYVGSSSGRRTPENVRRRSSRDPPSGVFASPIKKKTEALVTCRKKELQMRGSATPSSSTPQTTSIIIEPPGGKYDEVGSTRARKMKNVKVPSSLAPYYRNAPIKNLKHPLEENIFSSLFFTLIAVAVALVVGVPILCGIGVILVGAVGIRYLVTVFHGMGSYARFICSNRQHPSSRSRPPDIFPGDRLAYANDVRWLGEKRASRCQSILHTLLVFEGAVEVNTLRHLIQTRVLRAETPEGELAYPRFLQKLVPVTAGYLWELDLTFDIQNHIFTGPTNLTSELQLQQYIGHLLSESLPESKPLWEIRVVPSYYGGGKDTMAVLRVHQCLADGMSLIRILSHSLSDHQQMHIPQRPHFAGMSFGFNVLRSVIVGPVTIFMWWFTTFRDKNLFSIPLPKLRKGKKRKFFQRWTDWWRRLRGGNSATGDNYIVDDKVSYCSTITSTSSSEGSLSSGSSFPTSSPPTSSSANRGKFVQAFRQDLSPQGTQPPHPSPVSSTHRQNPSDDTQQQQTQQKSSYFEAMLSKSKNINKCLSKRSNSKSSLKSQEGKDTTTAGKLQHSTRRKKTKKRRKKKVRGRKRDTSKGSLRGSSSSSTFSSYSSSPPMWNISWSAPLSVPKVARVKQIMRSSYNDVLLSAAAGSVRMYLQEQGIPYPGDLQVVIPVDLRNDISSPKQSTRLGCKVASVLAAVPAGIESGIPRLWATRHRLDELKASADPVVAYGATAILMNVLPQRIAIPILESITDKASLQFSNLPGPTSTVVIGGYALKGIYPMYPPPGRVRAAISVFTYADQVHITVLSHRSLINAGSKILRGMTEQVDQLSRQLSQRRVPGESRRSARNFNQANNSEITKPPTRQIQLQLQVVQEELALLHSRLEAQGVILSDQDYGLPAICRLPPGLSLLPSSSISTGYSSSSYPDQSSEDSVELSTAGQMELQNRLKSLKNEFAELIGELRRRSSIVEGIAMSFEAEENEEYRKPRKRALSVVSMTRRSSIFSSRSNTALESPVYSSDEELPSSPPPEIRPYATCSNIRHTSSPMRTTAV